MNIRTIGHYVVVTVSAVLGLTTSAVSSVLHAINCASITALEVVNDKIDKEDSKCRYNELVYMTPFTLALLVCDIVDPLSSDEDIPPDTAKDSSVSEEERSALNPQDQAIDQHRAAEEGESEEHLSKIDDEGRSVEPKEEAVSSEKLGVDNASKTTPPRMDGHNA